MTNEIRIKAFLDSRAVEVETPKGALAWAILEEDWNDLKQFIQRLVEKG